MDNELLIVKGCNKLTLYITPKKTLNLKRLKVNLDLCFNCLQYEQLAAVVLYQLPCG